MSLLFSSLLYLLSLSTVNNFSNDVPDSSQKHDYTYYLQKSKRQMAIGVITTSVGIVGASAILVVELLETLGDAFVSIISLGYATPQAKERSYTIPLIVASAVTGIGITLIVAGFRNKKKARSLSADVGMGSTSQLQQQYVKSYAYPQLSFKFHF